MLIAAALAVGVLLVYSPVLGPEVAFVRWDDGIVVVNNPHIRSLSWDNIRWMFTDAHWTMRYTPLSWINWAIRYQLFGMNARTFHAGGVVLHAANSVLLFFLIRTLLPRFERLRSINASQRDFASACAAAVWALHPLRVETVAWVTHEQFTLALCFGLLAANVYVRVGGPRDPKFWAAALLMWAAALAHPIVTPLPALFLIADLYPLRRYSQLAPLRRVVKLAVEKIPMAVVPLFVAGMTMAARAAPQRSIWPPPPTLAEFDLLHRLAQVVYVWAYYLWRPLVPIRHSPVYTTLLDFSPWEPRFVVSALLLLALGAVSIGLRRRLPGLAALFACHLLVLAPVTGFAEHPHWTSDRYAYVQGAVMAVAVGWLIAVACTRWQALQQGLSVTLAAVVLCLAILSFRLSFIWQGSAPLFEHVLRELRGDPYSANIHWRLGEAYLAQKRYTDAARCADASLAADPKMFRALIVKGAAALQLGHAGEAVAILERAIAVDDSEFTTQRLLGMALLADNRPADAEAALRKSIALAPDDPETHWWLGEALYRQGEHEGARAEYARTLQLAPNHKRARDRLAEIAR